MRGVSDSDGYFSRLTDVKKWDVFPQDFPAGEYSTELTADTLWHELASCQDFFLLKKNKN